VSYENPQVPHEVNVSRESVLSEFVRLATGLCLVVLAPIDVPADDDRIARLKQAAEDWNPAHQPLRPVGQR